MEKEFIKETQHSVTLNVTAGKIDSFRETERTTGTVRVYENGCIGVAGALGEPDEEKLTEQAKEALSFGIPYPCQLDGALEIEERDDEEILPIPALVPTMQDFLNRLGALCPKFAFSHKITLAHNRKEYRNSRGRHLVSEGRSFEIALIAQNRGSGNLFDTFFVWSGKHFDADAVLAYFKEQYDAFFTPADLEPGRYPVVGGAEELYGASLQHFVGDLYAAGASLLSGKLNEKVFSDQLTMRDNMNPKTADGACFFDAEGCVAEHYRPTLIENGVLKAVVTTKKTAAEYGLPHSENADAPYDGVPGIGFHGLYVEPTAKTLKELVPGKAILMVIASGGDMTPEGHFATPVQMAYLLENGKIKGRLPEISIGGDFFDMFGKDYIGTVRDVPYKNAALTAVMMDVSRS